MNGRSVVLERDYLQNRPATPITASLLNIINGFLLKLSRFKMKSNYKWITSQIYKQQFLPGLIFFTTKQSKQWANQPFAQEMGFYLNLVVQCAGRLKLRAFLEFWAWTSTPRCSFAAKSSSSQKLTTVKIYRSLP